VCLEDTPVSVVYSCTHEVCTGCYISSQEDTCVVCDAFSPARIVVEDRGTTIVYPWNDLPARGNHNHSVPMDRPTGTGNHNHSVPMDRPTGTGKSFTLIDIMAVICLLMCYIVLMMLCVYSILVIKIND
jgi:hypothetical protein